MLPNRKLEVENWLFCRSFIGISVNGVPRDLICFFAGDHHLTGDSFLVFVFHLIMDNYRTFCLIHYINVIMCDVRGSPAERKPTAQQQ